MRPYSPKDGEVWDERLWGVKPTHRDPDTNQNYACAEDNWFQMNWSSPNHKYIGFKVTNKDVIRRLVRI